MKYILILIFTLQVSSNPSEVGPVGPQLNSSSLELIKPRRSTQMMPQFSLSKERIKSLFDFINK